MASNGASLSATGLVELRSEPASGLGHSATIPSAMLHAKILGEMFGYMGQNPIYNQHLASYRDQMVADGWSIEPTYPTHEDETSAARLQKQGFICQMLTRSKEPKHYNAAIHMWGPDGLAIDPPFPYSFAACEALVTTCRACGAKGVPTERVGFAGRVCAACLPAARKKIETPGWNN